MFFANLCSLIESCTRKYCKYFALIIENLAQDKITIPPHLVVANAVLSDRGGPSLGTMMVLSTLEQQQTMTNAPLQQHAGFISQTSYPIHTTQSSGYAPYPVQTNQAGSWPNHPTAHQPGMYLAGNQPQSHHPGVYPTQSQGVPPSYDVSLCISHLSLKFWFDSAHMLFSL